MGLRMCSADSHVYEPADLWTSRLPKAMRSSALDRAYFDGGRLGLMEKVPTVIQAGEAPAAHLTFSRPFGADGRPLVGGVEERLKALDADGVWAEVLQPDNGMMLFNTRDGELSMAHARVYNDYLGETYAKRPDRFIPLAAIPLHDIGWATKEIERTAKLGLRGALLPLVVPVSYAHAMYDPVWAALQDHGLTATFHAGTGFDTKGTAMEVQSEGALGAAFPTEEPESVAQRCFSGVLFSRKPQELVAALVGGGVCHRYPRLTFISAENDASWLVSLVGTMERAYGMVFGEKKSAFVGFWDPAKGPDSQAMMRDFSEFGGKWPYPLRPGDYVRRQIRCTFMDDRMAIACRQITGLETLMWAADYPHQESTFPSSRAIVDGLFAGVSAADRDAMIAGTLAKLYGLNVPPAP